MLELPHTALGAAIGTKIPNPLIAIPLSLVSHFFLDLIPHWNPSLYRETKAGGRPTRQSTKIVVVDTFLSLVLGFLIASRVWPNLGHFLVIIFSCFAAVFFDVIEAPYFFLKFRPRFLRKWIKFQHRLQGRASKTPGLLTQLLATLIALAIVFV